MTKIIIGFIFVFLNIGITHAQVYNKVKVTLRDGVVLEGKKGFITQESISFTTGTAQQTYSLYDVNLIQAKQGKAKKWALGCGGGCVGLCVVSGIVQGSDGLAEYDLTPATYAAGCAIWVGICAGAGALIGHLTDDYETVYTGSSSSILKNFKFSVGTNQFTKYNLILAYRFPN